MMGMTSALKPGKKPLTIRAWVQGLNHPQRSGSPFLPGIAVAGPRPPQPPCTARGDATSLRTVPRRFHEFETHPRPPASFDGLLGPATTAGGALAPGAPRLLASPALAAPPEAISMSSAAAVAPDGPPSSRSL